MHTIPPDVMSSGFPTAGATQHMTTCNIVKTAVYLVWFTLLLIGLSLIARKFGDARTPTSALVHTHSPITRGGVIYAVGTLSRAHCARCLADRRERQAARAAQHVLAPPLPPYPSLSPAPLSPLPVPGLGWTGLDGRASPASPPAWL